MIPYVIDADDIRKGDHIRATYVSDDITITREGVAHHRVGASWVTEPGSFLWSQSSGSYITLLGRPAPADDSDFDADAIAWHHGEDLP